MQINTGTPSALKILIAPLDWGLGHATRCIPIIQVLIESGCSVTIASSGRQAELLHQEFPNLELVRIPAYEPSYGKSRVKTLWKIIFQLPKLLTAIKTESQWLDTFLDKNRFDIIISDNRYGLYRDDVFCVFITHQLRIKSPTSLRLERIIQRWNYSYINRFSECWVPDYEGADNLAGELSHPKEMPSIPVKYLGGLSRFSVNAPALLAEVASVVARGKSIFNPNARYDVLIILSGPEPQRTLLEEIIMEQLSSFTGTAAIVRGLPGKTGDSSNRRRSEFISVFEHLSAETLNSLILQSEYVVSRAGYTTVMDMIKLRKKSIVIPTPGQTEQEYLGAYLMSKQLCICKQQRGFALMEALEEAKQFDYANMDHFDMELYRTVISSTLYLRDKKKD